MITHLNWLSFAMIVYTGMIGIPAQWIWYTPISIEVGDGPGSIRFNRTVKREFVGAYSGTIRNVTTSTIACDFSGGPFPYKPESILPGTIDLGWWTGGKAACLELPQGSYVLETCWTVIDPIGGVLPDKRACLSSNVFKVWMGK